MENNVRILLELNVLFDRQKISTIHMFQKTYVSPQNTWTKMVKDKPDVVKRKKKKKIKQ